MRIDITLDGDGMEINHPAEMTRMELFVALVEASVHTCGKPHRTINVLGCTNDGVPIGDYRVTFERVQKFWSW